MIHPLKSLSLSAPTSLLVLGVICALLGCEGGKDDVALVSMGAQAQGVEEAQVAQAPGASIVARVNDREIELHEVESRLDRISELYAQNQRLFDDQRRASKRRQVVQRLIDEELIRDHLRREAIVLENQEVEDHLDRYVSRRFGSPAAFHRYLATEGLELSDVRGQVRDELGLRHLLLAQNAEVEEGDLRAAYERIVRGRPAAERVRVTVVGLPLPSDAEEEVRDRIRQELEASLARVMRLPDLEKLSIALEADLGTRWVERYRASPYAAKVLFGEDSLGLAPLVETPAGFEIYWVSERREAGIRHFDEVEELLRERVLRARLERGRRVLLESLRRDATIEVNLPESERNGQP